MTLFQNELEETAVNKPKFQLVMSDDVSTPNYTVVLDAADSIAFDVPDYPAHYTITASFQGSNGIYDTTFVFSIGDVYYFTEKTVDIDLLMAYS